MNHKPETVNKILLILVILLFQIPCHGADTTDEFKLVKYQNSVALYERWVQHNGEEVRELKAEFTIKAQDKEAFIQLLRDEKKGLAWNANVINYRVLPGKTSRQWMVYLKYDIPWPLNDNDCLLSFSYANPEPDEKVTEILFSSTESSHFPVTEGVNRITGTKGKWILEDIGGSFKVTYFIATDRSRTIPRWISDPLIHDNLCRTMTAFKRLLEEKS